MKISTILDHIDSGYMALPEFQRGYVWNRDQVRGLMDSLYKKHPVGSLLVWATNAEGAPSRGDGKLAPGVVKLLLDGQQRMTSLYGIIRGEAPRFFDGNEDTFTGLRFHVADQEFAFYSPVKMKDDPLWIDVSELMKAGNHGLGVFVTELSRQPDQQANVGEFAGRLGAILGIRDIDLHVEEVTGRDKTIDIVVDIFNRVNSGGTKLSKGDLALAKICADWPEARSRMKRKLKKWEEAGYSFNLDWLLRSVNTLLTGEAKFQHLHDAEAEAVQSALGRAERSIDYLLNLIASRLGLDHDRVFFGRFAIPVLAHFVDRKGGHLSDPAEIDKLLFWYLQSGMWGRFSGSTESYIDQDLKLLEELEGGPDRLIEQLRLWHGGLRVDEGHFAGWSLGARFYPVLYLLTRVGEARDWWFGGLPLKKHLLGKMAGLELHHIFPKAKLYEAGYSRPEVNAVANFCFQTKETNLWISDRKPKKYLPKVREEYPGALESQWVPMDPELWEIERYPEFLAERRKLLAAAANGFLDDLLHRPAGVAESEAPAVSLVLEPGAARAKADVLGGVESEEEETELLALSEWVAKQGLPEGELMFELADEESGEPLAMFDLAWPDGIQAGYSAPVAVLINEGPEILELANAHGYRYFTDSKTFKRYVSREVLARREAV